MLQRAPRHTFHGQTSFRKLVGLYAARSLDARPECIPVGRPRGIKAKGLRYERIVAKALLSRFGNASGLTFGQWFEYHDANGRGYAQVDMMLYDISKDIYVIGEIKLTDTPAARKQLDALYIPVVEMAMGTRAVGMVIARNLTSASATSEIFDKFIEAARCAQQGRQALWHYLGRGMFDI